ncbi:MAG: polysaccharide biosynthesis/export family protein [Pseudomonadota bacterium]
MRSSSVPTGAPKMIANATRLAPALFTLALCALIISGCAASQQSRFDPLLVQPYALDSGDALRITVFDQPSLTEVYTVDPEGMISVPLVGDLPARGLTTDELDTNLTQALRAGFLRNPDVSVEIATFRPFFVLGEVGTAGQYPYVAGMTVRGAVAIAGGFAARAVRNEVKISRTINGRVIEGRLGLDAAVRPGDVITVRERWF